MEENKQKEIVLVVKEADYKVIHEGLLKLSLETAYNTFVLLQSQVNVDSQKKILENISKVYKQLKDKEEKETKLEIVEE